LDRIRDNLHIVLCFSPANEKFAEVGDSFLPNSGVCFLDLHLLSPIPHVVSTVLLLFYAQRARRFPGLITVTNIDWFLKWPQEALLEVSRSFLTEDPDFKVEVANPQVRRWMFLVSCDGQTAALTRSLANPALVPAMAQVEAKLVTHIANVHNLVGEACEEYFHKFRRSVYVTPKSYLSTFTISELSRPRLLDQLASLKTPVSRTTNPGCSCSI